MQNLVFLSTRNGGLGKALWVGGDAGRGFTV